MKKRYKRLLAGALAAMLLVPMSPGDVQTTYAKTAGKVQAGAQAESYTIRFDARKGTKVKKTLTLSPQDVYGKLPKTSREGYEFKGWYTKKSGGKRITAKSVFTGKSDQVLYAHWKKAVQAPEETPPADSGADGTDTPDGGNTGKPGGTDTPDGGGAGKPGEEMPGPDTPDVPGQTGGFLVPYQKDAAVDYKKNDYSNFLVLKNFKPEYLYCQYDYKRFVNSSGKNVGCTATADAMLASIYLDRPFCPDDEGWIPGVGATWTNSVVAGGSKTYSVQQQCTATYGYLQEGMPVLIRVIGHSVTAIGVRKGVTKETVKPSDLLIADPADGKVKRADEMGYRVMTDANGWGLRIPKETLLPKSL